jgi:hypothetical protein
VLTLSADVRPGWATFDPATGSLSGTPTEHDVGRSSAVVIRATDGEATVALAFTIQVLRGALGSASLLWAPPTENEDGTPLVDLAGYKLYWGTTENVYPHSVTLMNPGITRYLVEELAPATWHFAITSINRQGIESGYSNLTIQEVL